MSRRTNFTRKHKAAKRKRQQQRHHTFRVLRLPAIDRRNCTACEGTGLDRAHRWPDGSHPYCETCDGYGIR